MADELEIMLWGAPLRTRWSDDSPIRLLHLFQRAAWSTPGPEREEFVGLLQHVVSIAFRRDWLTSLQKLGLLPEDCAQAALLLLVRKAAMVWQPIALKASRGGGQPKLLLKSLYTAATRSVLTDISGVRRKPHADIVGTDAFGDSAAWAGAFGGLHGRAESPRDRAVEHHDARALFAHLGSSEAQDAILGDIVIVGERTPAAVERLYALCAAEIAETGAIVPHNRLPAWIRSAVSPELHALIASRLIRRVRAYAAGPIG